MTTKSTQKTKAKAAGSATEESTRLIQAVPHSKIRRTPDHLNSRLPESYTMDSLQALADSIRLSKSRPVILARWLDETKGEMEIVDGNRRFLANELAGNSTIDVKVGNFGDGVVAEFNVAYNLGAQDLTDYEECRALVTLHETYNYTLAQLGKVWGLKYGGKAMDPALVSKRLTLWRELSPVIKENDFKRAHPMANWRFLHDSILKTPGADGHKRTHEEQEAAWNATLAAGGRRKREAAGAASATGAVGDDGSGSVTAAGGVEPALDRNKALTRKQVAGLHQEVQLWMERLPEDQRGPYRIVIRTLGHVLGIDGISLPVEPVKAPEGAA